MTHFSLHIAWLLHFASRRYSFFLARERLSSHEGKNVPSR